MIKYLKYAGIGFLVLFVIGTIFSNIHVIKDTEVGVFVRLGKIQPDVAKTGLTFTTPFIEDLRRVDTTENKVEYTGITLATKADAASPATGNIVITYAIVGEEAPAILIEFGTVGRFIDTRLNQPMFSQARILASAIQDTRQLMTPEARLKIGNDLRDKLDASHSGYHIRNVMVQSILPHATISKRINDAAQRREDDVIEKHNLKLAVSVADTATAKAEGIEKVEQAKSRVRAFEVTTKANADAGAIKAVAEAKKEAMFSIAEGNKKLSLTLTANILHKQELDNQKLLFSKSKGLVPHTVIGDTDLRAYGFPTMGQ
jgi:regulator of protease activity HflC (stomatin/prohibitin superfamily)